ncbi:hypothetical protein [Metabacillus iocasae]|uniref:Threonine dehydratase n=1 Tax=Priestia iocasae TaxID=2291674 RepID=A0ABS2QVH8_9BACI|nr:hypothetical protein [Metabacillus iocasae]MBM7703203.1 hypothetical protein [Metabacillus iocasae]
MEYSLQSYDGAFPCEVTIDEDNGRFMLRNADTSGQVFNNIEDLIHWVEDNWQAEQFTQPDEYTNMLLSLKRHLVNRRNTFN